MTFKTYETFLQLRIGLACILMCMLAACATVDTVQTEDAICPSPRVPLISLTIEQVNQIPDDVLLILATNNGVLKDRIVYLETLLSSHDESLGGCT